MEINTATPSPLATNDSLNMKILVGIFWVFTTVISAVVGFSYGRNTQVAQLPVEKNTVLGSTSEIAATPTESVENILPSAPTNITPTSTAFCKKAGFAQKWEYLTPYIIKENDSFQSIATRELQDATRVNEITQLNGIGQLVVGSTVYLPPPSVSKSSGNLKQVYGKLSDKNSVSWHINFSVDPNGQGLLIPSFWFEGLANSNTFKIGDCVKVFFEDGYKVFSIALQ